VKTSCADSKLRACAPTSNCISGDYPACCTEACAGDVCQVCTANRCGLSTATICAPGPCSANGDATCIRVGSNCDKRPNQTEICRWVGISEAQCGAGSVFQVITRESHYGIWTAFGNPFALEQAGTVPAPPGSCITQVPNLCSPGAFDKCRAYAATSCERITNTVSGNRNEICRWRSVGEAQCGTVMGPGPPPLMNRGIWTVKGDGFDSGNPGSVQEGNGACITMVTNLP
jgi:hypothetical protein